MWREYIGLVGAAVAVANGVFAMTVAVMPVRLSVAKRQIAVVALVLAVGAVGATFYSKHLAAAGQEHRQTERREIRQRLESFSQEGRTLLGQIRDAQRELPNKSADAWAQRAELYIRDKLDERYVARFRRDVGDMYGDGGVPAARLGYWRAVRNRVVNLELISAEFSETSIAFQ